MPTIKFIEFNGTEHVVEAANGTSAMKAALIHGVPGIDGDCGGLCACATCHVYVDEAWKSVAGQRNEQEDSMVSFSPILAPNSRLSCQIQIQPVLDGLVLRLPECQQ